MLKVRTKSITRSDWPLILKRSFVYKRNFCPSFSGSVALLQMETVQKPIIAHSCGKTITFADNGYFWIQLAPAQENWWLTAMADPEHRIIQYYFDITSENRLTENTADFDDIFLDVVALPDGSCELLDRDELNEALHSQVITRQQYEMALKTAAYLMENIPKRIHELNRFIESCINGLESELVSV